MSRPRARPVPAMPAPAARRKFRDALLKWYRAHGRDLPWRRTDDPYHILVSEVMLQQTQVDRVLPKYAEWLTRYPSLGALAAGSNRLRAGPLLQRPLHAVQVVPRRPREHRGCT